MCPPARMPQGLPRVLFVHAPRHPEPQWFRATDRHPIQCCHPTQRPPPCPRHAVPCPPMPAFGCPLPAAPPVHLRPVCQSALEDDRGIRYIDLASCRQARPHQGQAHSQPGPGAQPLQARCSSADGQHCVQTVSLLASTASSPPSLASPAGWECLHGACALRPGPGAAAVRSKLMSNLCAGRKLSCSGEVWKGQEPADADGGAEVPGRARVGMRAGAFLGRHPSCALAGQNARHTV